MPLLTWLLAEGHEIAVPSADIGTWVVTIFIVMGGLWTALQIYDRIVPKQKEIPPPDYVTKEKYEVAHVTLKSEVKASSDIIVSRLDTIEKKVEVLDEYAHNRNHDMVNEMHAMNLKLTVVAEILPKNLENITKQVQLMGARLDRMGETMTCPAARAEGKLQ